MSGRLAAETPRGLSTSRPHGVQNGQPSIRQHPPNGSIAPNKCGQRRESVPSR